MNVDYKGFSCRYDPKTNTYSRPPVKIRYPCGICGSDRRSKWVQGKSGGWRNIILECCPKQS